jgi:hypothetical protein
MTDQTPQDADQQTDKADLKIQEAAEMIEEVGGRVSDGLNEIMGGLGASAVFEVEEIEGRHFVTAAAIERGGGFGFGAGAGGDDDTTPTGGGGGGGGGGSAQARPVAIIEITADDVKIRPVLDFTRVGLTVLISAITVWRLVKR